MTSQRYDKRSPLGNPLHAYDTCADTFKTPDHQMRSQVVNYLSGLLAPSVQLFLLSVVLLEGIVSLSASLVA